MARRPAQPIHLFQSNPPPDRLLRALFVNREIELVRAIAKLESAKDLPQLVCAIHGDRRVGKSHFVRVLLEEVTVRKLAYSQMIVNANNRGSARAILDVLMHDLWSRLQGYSGDSRCAAVAKRMNDALYITQGFATQILTETADTTTDTFRGTQEIGIPGAFKATGGGDTAKATALRQSVTSAAPTDATVLSLVVEALGALAAQERKTMLVVVDDLDLIERDGSEGGAVADEMTRLLRVIAECGTALVLVTVRQASFNGRNKDFYNFLQLRALSPDEIRQVYQRHIDELNAGEPFLTAEALDQLLKLCRNRVGAFLERCQDIWQHHAAPVTPDTLVDWARETAAEPDDDVIHVWAKLRSAAQNGVLEVEIEPGPGVEKLRYKAIHPVAGQPGRYEIDELFVRALA